MKKSDINRKSLKTKIMDTIKTFVKRMNKESGVLNKILKGNK